MFSTCQLHNPGGGVHRVQTINPNTGLIEYGKPIDYRIIAVNQPSDPDISNITIIPALQQDIDHDQWLFIKRHDNSEIAVYTNKASAGVYPAANNTMTGSSVIQVTTGKNPSNQRTPFQLQRYRAPHHLPQKLGWNNCWSFGNGIESDRIRDDYNANRLANGVKASTVLATPYAEEHRSSGLIWSGIFNSTSGVNDLNQFIQAEPITKDLSPRHGSLQKLVARDTDTIAFCEDKVLRLLTNKDALFNADGNSNVTSTNNVIGQATPISGDYGISTNPESLAVTPFGMYWADQMRGQVLSLEGGSIVSISDMGMKDYFSDNLKDLSQVIGTYDEKKNEYNVTLCNVVSKQQYRPTTNTISYNEITKGWTSFKDFGPEKGVSLNNAYYTFDQGSIWEHHTNALTNNFYGSQYYSDFTLIFNDQPGSVKSFGTINYEGTQSRITQFTTDAATGLTDKEYYNLNAKKGWYVDSLTTDLQEIDDIEFKNKEGKWFGAIKGVTTTLGNLDEREFSVQGLGAANSNTTGVSSKKYNYIHLISSTNFAGNVNWDSTADSGDWKVFSYGYNSYAQNASVTQPANLGNSHFINNMINPTSTVPSGFYSGLDLDAKDFSVPGGTLNIVTATMAAHQIHILNGASIGDPIYTYTDGGSWNADGGTGAINKIEISNRGIAGDPANMITVMSYGANFTMPGNVVQKNFDLDHVVTVSNGGNTYRDACVHVTYSEHSADNVVIAPQTPISGINRADNVNFVGLSSTNISTDQWSGTVLEGVGSVVASYTITASSGYHLSVQGNTHGADVYWSTRLANAAWEPYYSYVVTDNYYTSSGNTNKIQSVTINISYNPPVGVTGLDPDPPSPEGGFCAWLHDVRIDYDARTLTTTTSLGGPKITHITLPKGGVYSPGDHVEICNHGTGMIPQANGGPASGHYYCMAVKLNSAQNGITHAFNWLTSAWVATTDLNGNTGPHGIGNSVAAAATQGNSTNPYRLFLNNHIQTNGGNAFLQPRMPLASTGYADGFYCTFLEAGDFTGTTLNMALGTGVPVNINTTVGSSWEVITNPSSSISGSTLTGTTRVGNAVAITAGRALSAVPVSANRTFNFSFTYNAGEGKDVTLTRQPAATDFRGYDQEVITGGVVQGGESQSNANFHIADTTGIKVGMYVEDLAFTDKEVASNRIRPGTKVASVNAGDSVTLTIAGDNILTGNSLRFFTDWKYDFENLAAVQNNVNQIVVTGTVRVRQYGKTTPSGNLELYASNFITVSNQ